MIVTKCCILYLWILGTNHGSLSARVMSYWGDSPKGMVESALEFANICRKYDFHNFLFSMKVVLLYTSIIFTNKSLMDMNLLGFESTGYGTSISITCS